MTVIWQEDHTWTCWVIKVNWPKDTGQHMCVIIKPTFGWCVLLCTSFIFKAFYNERKGIEFQRIVEKYILWYPVAENSMKHMHIKRKYSFLISHTLPRVILLFLCRTDGLVVIGHRWGFRGNIKHPTQCYICPGFDSKAEIISKLYCLLPSRVCQSSLDWIKQEWNHENSYFAVNC